MVATLSRTSCVAASMSRSSVKVMLTARLALIGVGAQLVDAADGVDGFLDPLGDLGLDFLGAGAGQLDLDVDDRRVGLRHQVEAEVLVGERARAR